MSYKPYTMQSVSIDHYENFPVASWLCPPRLRPAVAAIYHFARTADDLADEGDASVAQRQLDLAAFRRDLRLTAHGGTPGERWSTPVFRPLGTVLQQFQLPQALLERLLDAFEQDLVQADYASRDELLAYCSRSANPVGRLLLHLYGITDARALERSDAVCSALQLINFWQDMSRDGPRGRVYVPQADLARHGVSAEQLRRCDDSPATRALMAELCDWAQALMEQGTPLVHQIPGRAGWELRLVVQGGLRILERIRAMNYATLLSRPTLGARDLPLMLWRAAWMRAPNPEQARTVA